MEEAKTQAQAQSHPLEDVALNESDEDRQTARPRNWVKFDDEADGGGEKNNNSDATQQPQQQQQQQNKLTLPPPPSVVSSNNNRRARSRSPNDPSPTTTTPVQVSCSPVISQRLALTLSPLRRSGTHSNARQALVALSFTHQFAVQAALE